MTMKANNHAPETASATFSSDTISSAEIPAYHSDEARISSLSDLPTHFNSYPRSGAAIKNSPTNSLKGRNKSTPIRKRGGRPLSDGLTLADAETILEGIEKLAQMGLAPNYMLTIHPAPEHLEDAKRALQCRIKIESFKKIFQRKGAQFYALSVYEKERQGKLHVHVLIHVPSRLVPAILKKVQRPETDIQKIAAKHLPYVLKERNEKGTIFANLEAKLGKPLRYRRGAPHRCKRWTWSADVKTLIEKQ